MKWWEMWPSRLEFEIEAFAEREWEPRDVTSAAQVELGVRELAICYNDSGMQLPLTVHFPPDYPFFKAYVYTDPDSTCLERHHNPINHEVCLIAGQNGWQPDMSMADLLSQNMPKVLKISEDPGGDFAAKHEEPQGEPLSSYLNYTVGTSFLVADISPPEGVNEGYFTASRTSNHQGVHLVLTEIKDKSKRSVSLSDDLNNLFDGNESFEGYWKRIRISSPGEAKELNNDVKLCELVNKALYRKKAGSISGKGFLFGIVFEQESEHGKYDLAWRVVYAEPIYQKSRNRKKFQKPVGSRLLALKFESYSREHRQARIPELASLTSKTVTIVGCGMLGSQVAIKLAQSGIKELKLIDGDTIDASTTVRYALGLEFCSIPKVEALKSYIERNYPFTSVKAINYMIGTPVDSNNADKREDAMSALGNTDMVIDAAAEPSSLSYFLSCKNRQNIKPMLVVTTRPGTWGGEVWNISDPDGPCWECLQCYQREQTLPIPNGNDESPQIQPAGCASLTVEGYGFDSDIISLHAVRAAAGILTDDEYPTPQWQALNINLRSPDGVNAVEQIQTFKFSQHPKCRSH